MDGHYCCVVDLVWPGPASPATPTISATTVPAADYPPHPGLEREMQRAYSGIQ